MHSLVSTIAIAGYLISFFSTGIAAQTTTSSGNTELLEVMIQAGAYAESLTHFCESNNARESARDRTQLEAWGGRNHWPSVQARINADPVLQQRFDTQKKSVISELNAHRFKSAFVCGLLAQELTSAAHDPSLKYRSQLQLLDAQPDPTNAAAPHSAAQQDQPPPPQSGFTSPSPTSAASPLVVATTGEAAGMPPTNRVTLGSVTFTPPAGWQLMKNASDAVAFQAATQHTKAVLLITEVQLAGEFRGAFFEALAYALSSCWITTALSA